MDGARREKCKEVFSGGIKYSYWYLLKKRPEIFLSKNTNYIRAPPLFACKISNPVEYPQDFFPDVSFVNCKQRDHS